jgi:hypothetical protein
MDWLFEADRDAERRFPWISIPDVASIRFVYVCYSGYDAFNGSEVEIGLCKAAKKNPELIA